MTEQPTVLGDEAEPEQPDCAGADDAADLADAEEDDS